MFHLKANINKITYLYDIHNSNNLFKNTTVERRGKISIKERKFAYARFILSAKQQQPVVQPHTLPHGWMAEVRTNNWALNKPAVRASKLCLNKHLLESSKLYLLQDSHNTPVKDVMSYNYQFKLNVAGSTVACARALPPVLPCGPYDQLPQDTEYVIFVINEYGPAPPTASSTSWSHQMCRCAAHWV